MSYTAYTSEPLDFAVAVTFDAGGPSTLVGGTVRADALNLDTGARASGVATIQGAASIRATFAAGALPAGRYEVQVIATPSGAAAQVVSASLWTVKRGAA